MSRAPLIALVLLTAATAQAATPPVRLRGTITKVDAGSVTLQTQDGTAERVALTATTRYAGVVAADASAIKPGTFIGTATKGTGSHLTSVEVVVFPPEMRGTGEGHYDWDKLPDPSGGSAVSTSMTNGTVSAGGPRVATSMTNGNVDSDTSKGGAMHLTVSYKGGQKSIVVPAGVPVVAVHPADKSVLKVGAAAFVIADPSGGTPSAIAAMAGEGGVKPPM